MPALVQELMVACWAKIPEDRPEAAEVEREVRKFLDHRYGGDPRDEESDLHVPHRDLRLGGWVRGRRKRGRPALVDGCRVIEWLADGLVSDHRPRDA